MPESYDEHGLGGNGSDLLNARQKKAAGLIILAVLLVGFCGSRGGDSTEQEPAGTVDHADAGGFDATPTPWVEGTRLVSDLPEVEPTYAVEAAPLPEPEVMAAAVPTVAKSATVQPAPSAGQLSEGEMRGIYAQVGVPAAWVEPLLAIAHCESKFRPEAEGDSGNSLGVHQLWTGWARAAGYSVEELYDPVINTIVAVYVREVRGRFGGKGGWTCADILGIW